MAHTTEVPSFERIDQEFVLEEETLRGYRAKNYYPVKFGQVFKDRYEVISKLGYGATSTVWLCRDLFQSHSHVALKVYINNSKIHCELPIYKHIDSLQSTHGGRSRVRGLLDSFEIEGPNGTHVCLAHQALGPSLHELRDLFDDKLFPPAFLMQTIRHILGGLEFLHQEAHVIHTGTSKLGVPKY
jgi:serine/threonine protein kinase